MGLYLHPMRHWVVRLYRDNRWDVYPQREPVEEILVACNNRAYLADAVIEQFPQWKFGFIFASVEPAGAAR